MSWISIFENLRFNGKFWRNIAPYVSGYLLVFIFILLGVWIAYGLDKYLMVGFTLFIYFPSWLRFVCLDLIVSSLIGIPFGIIAGFFISVANENHHIRYLDYISERLKVNCIDCSNEIVPQGMWMTGQTDIRCKKCGALMAVNIEEGKFKKLSLKEPAMKYR